MYIFIQFIVNFPYNTTAKEVPHISSKLIDWNSLPGSLVVHKNKRHLFKNSNQSVTGFKLWPKYAGHKLTPILKML